MTIEVPDADPIAMTGWLNEQVAAVRAGYERTAASHNIMDVAGVTIDMELAWTAQGAPTAVARALTLAISVLALERAGMNTPGMDPLPQPDPEPTPEEVEAFKAAWQFADESGIGMAPGTRTAAGLRAALAVRFAR